MKLLIAVVIFVCSWTFIAFAQSSPPSVATPVGAAVASVGFFAGIWAWVVAHGGLQASILLLVSSAFAILSAIRKVLKDFDGIADGDSIPATNVPLTLVNKICIFLGQVIDFATGNVQH